MRRRWWHLSAVATTIVAATLTATPEVDALEWMTPEERGYAAWVQANRAWHGAPPILLDGHLTAQAQLQADRLAANGQLSHSPSGELVWWVQQGWTAGVAENVATADTARHAHEAVAFSAPHLANQLNPGHRGFGVAVRRGSDGRVYTVETYGGF